MSSSPERKKRGGKNVEAGCEKQTTITLALGGPREPDHVAIETQVQQKVTGKSIRIELISPALPPHLPAATAAATKLLFFLTVAALMQHKNHHHHRHVSSRLCLRFPCVPHRHRGAAAAARKRRKKKARKKKRRHGWTQISLRLLSCSFSFFSLSLSPSLDPSPPSPPPPPSSLPPAEGPWQLCAGDKRVQRRCACL